MSTEFNNAGEQYRTYVNLTEWLKRDVGSPATVIITWLRSHRLVCERYEHGSITLTSNKFFSDWGELMSDTIIATAMLDRLLHHAHVVNIRGDTYRLKDRRKSGVALTPPAQFPAVG